MSEFDKEAERERLREKYERDREDREVAQKMSDLLLKGATMTNAHCGECGSPIFRHEGREFCPVCGAEVVDAEDAAVADGDASETAEGAGSDGVASEAGAASRDATAAARDATAADATTPDETLDAGAAGTPDPAPPTQDRQAAPATDDVSASADATVSTDGQPTSEAAAALQRALVRHARAAETDDPRVARDHLEAAREAAEALAALRRQG